MARIPRTVKIKKGGIEFTSNVDRASFLIHELIRAALMDVAKLIRKRLIDKLKQLPGMRKNRRLYKSTQYWVRRRETDLQIGFKHDSWYGAHSELGDRHQPARGLLKGTVMENLDDIRRIQGHYLSSIEQENKALGLIDPKNEGDNDEGS